MNTRPEITFRRALLLAPPVIFLFASAAFAEPPDNWGFAILMEFLFLILAFFLAFYIYHALALQTIARKTNRDDGWLAWIPIANLFLMVMIAKKPVWWVLLFFIPLVNFVVIVLVWMAIAETRGKPNWWGILYIIPPVSIIVPGYLAWSD